MSTDKGVWNLQDVRDKQLQSLWNYSGAPALYAIGGENNYGQLGLNDTVLRSSPIQVPGTNWDANNIRYIGNHSLLMKTDGTLWTMGAASWGKLGLNAESVDQSSPTQIPGTNWSRLANSDNYVIGLKTDGTLWAIGRNPYGQFGNNNLVRYSSPVQVAGGETGYTSFMTAGYSLLSQQLDETP